MKLLLDENMPRKLLRHLHGHDVATVAYMGWGGVKNGQLLRKAADEGFDALLTVDAGLQFQQNLHTLPCSVVIIHSLSNAFEHLEPHLPAILKAIESLKPRTLIEVG